MEREETNGNAEGDTNGDTEDTATASERGTPEGFDSLEDSNASLEMEQSETGRKTSIFRLYSYKSAGECAGTVFAVRGARKTGFRADGRLGDLISALTTRNCIAVIARGESKSTDARLIRENLIPRLRRGVLSLD